MIINKEQLTDIKEKFEKAQSLIDEDSKHDPPTEPYRSHYLARDIFLSLETKLKNLIKAIATKPEKKNEVLIYKAILGFVYKDIGKINVFTEEISNGEKYFTLAIKLLEEHKMDPVIATAYMDNLNQLGLLWSARANAEESQKYLAIAESFYDDYKALNIEPLTLSDIFGSDDEVEVGKGTIGFEKVYTLTLYYLAQVIGGEGNLSLSAKYCHRTLKRQLEYNDYETMDWALNAATLSQYYFTENNLKQSRHLLAAASYMLDKYEEEMVTTEMTPEQKEAKLQEFQHRSADVSRCWAKYAIYILSTSKDRLLHDNDDRDQLGEVSSGKTSFDVCTDIDEFKTLSLSLYENQIIDDFILTFDEAKLVFLSAQSWLNKAKEYYTSESEASEYAIITQDLAALYKHLAFFDEDDDNQCKLHKRRADLLEDLIKLLNPTYYLNICRECWYELGLTYATMLDIKLSKLEKLTINERPTPHQLQKINILCEKGINGFTAFIDSYRDKKTLDIPDTITDEEMQPILFAYFHIGRLFYKITTPDRRREIMNLNNSLSMYALFVKKVEEREALMGPFGAELSVCREMVNLLPLKIKKLYNEGVV